MKIQFGHSAVILDHFTVTEGWCSDFWNSHETFFLADDQMKVHRYVDSVRLQCLRNALQPGRVCTEFSLHWVRDGKCEWVDHLLRRHAYRFRLIHDELMALPWVQPEGKLRQYKPIHPHSARAEAHRSDISSIRTYSPFTEVKPLKEAPKKWTIAHVTRALLAGQFKGLTCDGVYSDDYAYDNAVNYHKGDFSDRAVHLARRIIESPSGWRCYPDNAWRKGISNLIHINCHSFDNNHFTFQLEPDPDMKRFNPLTIVAKAESRVTNEAPVTQTPNSSLATSQSVAIKKSRHTKKQHDIWICRLGERVDKEEFIRVLDEAKRLGGYWSNYGTSEMRGFIFKSEESAKRFVGIIEDPMNQAIAFDRRVIEEASNNVVPVDFNQQTAPNVRIISAVEARPWRRLVQQ